MSSLRQNLQILAAAAVVVALPFALRRAEPERDWKPGDPRVVVISAHNEAIRAEFGRGFAAWHAKHHGRPAKVEWLSIGGTTEIMRYLASAYIAAAREWWKAQGRDWPEGAADVLLDRKFNTAAPPETARREGESESAWTARAEADRKRWELLRDLHKAFRATDDPSKLTSRMDVFFGGGAYDHSKAAGQGFLVAPWPPDQPPVGVLTNADGRELIPAQLSGEVWRDPLWIGAAVSTFSICYNKDRLRDLGLEAPKQWDDLADPAYFRQIGVADPTKSSSIAKSFEMMIQQKIAQAVRAAGFSDADVDAFEKAFAKAAPGARPDNVPAAYQQAVEKGWLDGVRLVQLIGANARYFTDSSSKVPVDVGSGLAAAGLAIDFYSRFQAQASRSPSGEERMGYVTPTGGTSVSCDPIALLRGAENRETAVRFIQYVLGEDGQRLWSYRAGEPGGPERYALRRVPIRRDFYPGDPAFAKSAARHAPHTSDNLSAPDVDPYQLGETFTYRKRWTDAHFGVQRDIVKAMCLDSGVELQAAWEAIIRHGGPAKQPRAMELLRRMPDRPEPLTWHSAPGIAKKTNRLDYLREWTIFFRRSYREARTAVIVPAQGTASTR